MLNSHSKQINLLIPVFAIIFVFMSIGKRQKIYNLIRKLTSKSNITYLHLPDIKYYSTDYDPKKVPDTVKGNSRGYLTTPQELIIIKRKAMDGLEPYKSAYDHLIKYANRPWLWKPLKGQITCKTSKEPAYLMKGSILVYAKTLAFQLTGKKHYAEEVIKRINDLLGITSFGTPGNSKKPDRQCQLNLSWVIPGFIRAADLLEDHPEWQNSGIKREFQYWLAEVVYPTISFTAEVSMSNWGAAATNAETYIADYLWDRPEIRLVSYNRHDAPDPITSRSPAEAYEHSIQLTLGRMNGTRVEGEEGSSRACDRNPFTKSMIRPDGGIPDELRRGSTGCGGQKILEDDKSNMYSQTHLQNLIAQAELLLRRGDRRIYENIQSDSLTILYENSKGVQNSLVLPPGRGSLKKAILFVVDYPSYQIPRALKSACEVAYRYYRHLTMLKTVNPTRPNSGGRAMSFETLTHGFATFENPGLPPTVAPPL